MCQKQFIFYLAETTHARPDHTHSFRMYRQQEERVPAKVSIFSFIDSYGSSVPQAEVDAADSIMAETAFKTFSLHPYPWLRTASHMRSALLSNFSHSSFDNMLR